MIRKYLKKLTELSNISMRKNDKIETNKYIGFYSNWKKALAQTSGYNDQHIFEKVKEAALKVKSGKAVFERDSVLFNKRIYNWALLAILLRISHQYAGKLNLIDFGGSLGSTYFQHRDFLSCLKEIRWNIIEQEHFVKFGKEHLASKELKFYYNIKDCLRNTKPYTFLASSVIGYIENPFKLIHELITYNMPNIIFDRIAFIESHKHEILIQKVSPIIYKSSYPMWALNYNKLISLFDKKYKINTEYESYIDTDYNVGGKRLYWRGIYFTKK